MKDSKSKHFKKRDAVESLFSSWQRNNGGKSFIDYAKENIDFSNSLFKNYSDFSRHYGLMLRRFNNY